MIVAEELSSEAEVFTNRLLVNLLEKFARKENYSRIKASKDRYGLRQHLEIGLMNSPF